MHNLKNLTQDLDAISMDNMHIAFAIGHDSDSQETKKANAAHIVRCVNSHDALVAALENIAAQPMANEWSRNIARAAIAKATQS